MDKINFLEDEFEDLKKSIFNNSSSGAIGKNASTTTGGAAGDNALSMSGFAGGQNARATVDGAVQLGQGTNNDANTLQFHSYKLLDEDGKIPNDRLNLDSQASQDSAKPISSSGAYNLTQASKVSITLNSTYVDTSQTGNAFYMRLGNLVFVYLNDITFKNVRQANSNIIASGLPAADGQYIFNMACYNGTLTVGRFQIDNNSTFIKNFFSTMTPTTSQKWSANFVYIAK